MSQTSALASSKDIQIGPPAGAFDKASDSTRAWFSPPVALVLGFGSGHAIQNRMRGYALAFPAADLAGWAFVLGSMGSCSGGCNGRKQDLYRIGVGTLIVSRLIQVVDVTIWSVNHSGSSKTDVVMLPTTDGVILQAGLKF